MGVENRTSNGATQRMDFILPASASSNSSALTADSAKAASTTEPTEDVSAGRFIFGDQAIVDRVLMELGFILTDAANETASAAVWGWYRIGGLWVPKLLCVLTITAGARPGVSGGDVTDTEFFADTIAASTDNTTRDVSVSGASDGIATAEIDHRGAKWIEVEVTSTSSATVKPFAKGL